MDPTKAPPTATEYEGPGESAVTEPSGEAEYTCFGPPIPESVWAAQDSAADVEHPGRPVLLEAVGPEGMDGWFLLEATDERLAVARKREVVQEPDGAPG